MIQSFVHKEIIIPGKHSIWGWKKIIYKIRYEQTKCLNLLPESADFLNTGMREI